MNYLLVLLKDVLMRNQIRNVNFLERFMRFLADNTGKLISANSISRYMKSQGEKIIICVRPISFIRYTVTTFTAAGYLKAMTSFSSKTTASGTTWPEENAKGTSKKSSRMSYIITSFVWVLR